MKLVLGICFAVCSVLCAAGLPAVTWTNIDNDHYIAGRKCSVGYLKGKVALVCRDVTLAARMEEIWTSFKTKPFVLIGSYDEAPKDVSYPVYRDVRLVERVFEEPVFIVDATQVVRFRGRDDRRATESLVTLLTDMEMPKTEKQWRKFLDYEFAELPGRACLRYADCLKSQPALAKEYEERYEALVATPDVKNLVELVRFSRGVKDLRSIKPEKRALLKEKNALADLAWVKAGILE